ncbi:Adam Eukaryotic translation initiation factor 3 subunit J [Nymphaea thermarum]|nr:Adam Eukaryotic translation initiation factor 3 subunit J [Nymphaea thermarum]
MEDWESEDFNPALPAHPVEKQKGLWDDEDIEDVKASWEDEDVPTAEKAPKAETSAEKPVTKPGGKGASSKKGKPAGEADEKLADPVAEKLRQQRLVEEADYKSTTELFARKGDEKTLDNFIPKSENDFIEYAELISHKLRPYEKSFHYINLLKMVMRLSMTSMKGAEAKEVASSVTAIANEKIKAEKEATGKKKPAKKKQLHVDKPDDDMVVAGYNDVDDYDFM